jgi:XRE family transcriptional regulator, aerobic/anaerobic benzoate catabolism transcriptional regulator
MRRKHDALLATVGARVRALRDHVRMSRRELAERSGVSERFLAQLEGGEGNISLTRFADVATALDTTPSELLAGPPRRRDATVALLGVRGAGKSTVGARLARQLSARFVEVDQRVEQAAGLRLGEIFEMHGEAYYRRLEREVLTQLLGDPRRLVLAAGGSIVNDPVSFGLLRDQARTVWLRARAEDHWNRVIQQGDPRPMADSPHAFSELRALLAAREPLYASSHHVVDTTGRSVDDVVAAVAAAVAA